MMIYIILVIVIIVAFYFVISNFISKHDNHFTDDGDVIKTDKDVYFDDEII